MFIAGGSGLIGGALAARLEREGHEVILGVRRVESGAANGRELSLDYGDPTSLARLDAVLSRVDVVVNAIGIFEGDAASFDAVHVHGPCSLFAAAGRAGVARIIQLSALGAQPAAAVAYLRTKARGDECAAAFPGRAIIVRPSLVFAPGGASTRWFLRLASLPWLPLPGGGRAPVQPLHLDDLVDGLAALVVEPDPPAVIDAVGPQALSFAEYLRTLGASLGASPRVLALPERLAAWLARWAAKWPGSLVSPDALVMLRQGSVADPCAWQQRLKQPMRAPARFVASADASALRAWARWDNLLPWLRASVSITWLVTAWVSAFVHPRADSLALLQRAQVPDALGPIALYGAAALDAVLGLAMWHPPWRALVYRIQLGLILFYTAVISLWLPEYWAHPYGPVLKNLPMLALIYALLRLEVPERGPGRR